VLGETVVQSMLDAFDVDFAVEETSSEGDTKTRKVHRIFKKILQIQTHESIPGRSVFLKSAHTGL
jgi:hypothetical protein